MNTQELRDLYSGWSDEELQRRFDPRSLTTAAAEAMALELKARGIDAEAIARDRKGPGVPMPESAVDLRVLPAEALSATDRAFLKEMFNAAGLRESDGLYVDAAALEYFANSGASESLTRLLRDTLGTAEGVMIGLAEAPGAGVQPAAGHPLRPMVRAFAASALVAGLVCLPFYAHRLYPDASLERWSSFLLVSLYSLFPTLLAAFAFWVATRFPSLPADFVPWSGAPWAGAAMGAGVWMVFLARPLDKDTFWPLIVFFTTGGFSLGAMAAWGITLLHKLR